MRSPPRSTADPARHSAGAHPPKYSTSIYDPSKHKPLRRPIESAQYVSGDYTQTLTDNDVLASVGSTGDAYDNSMAESFVDSFKTELITDRVWQTRNQMELAIVEYISWFNDSRLHENLGDRPPREIEELYAVKTRTTTPTT
jgi:putative transposase